MSVEPGWSSTMFPVIFAVNQFLTALAFSLMLFLVIASRPPVKDVMRPKFQLDMATLMLALTLFWTYTSFSQFMLIWVGNLPEEIPFYLKRSAGGWWWVSAALAVFHFALPFLVLLFRDIKLHPVRLRVVAAYLLIVCALDVVWWNAPAQEPGPFSLAWLMDVGAIAAVGGVWGLYFFMQLKQRSILAKDETYLLPEGHHHEQH
jgi:magnesium-transporting ATPase (P-type)